MELQYVRLSFPDVFKPVEYKTGDGKFRYNATFLVDPGSVNDQKIEAEIVRVANEAFGAKAQQFLDAWRGQTNKYAYLDGSKVDYDGYAGKKYLAAHTPTRPGVFNIDGTPLTAEDGLIYGGCYVDAIVNIWAQSGENSGIRCSFSGIRFRAEGEAFGGGAAAKPTDFSPIATVASVPAPVAATPTPVVPNAAFMTPPPVAAHVPVLTMTAKAAGATAEQFRGNGWTDQMMLDQGYAVMQ